MPRRAESNREQLPHTPALRDAVIALRALRESYVAVFDVGKKGGRRWGRCTDAHQAAKKALEDPRAASMVDECVTGLHHAGNGAPDQALKILNATYRGKGQLERLERRLARGAGFSDGELRRFLKNARRCLKRARGGNRLLPHVTDSRGLVQHLADAHELADEVLFEPLSGHPAKTAERLRAAEQIDGRLYMVISVVANSDHRRLFNASYAAGVGAAGHRGLERKALVPASRSLPPGISTPAPSSSS